MATSTKISSDSDAYNCIAWLNNFIWETVKDFDGSDLTDMETRLMKIESLMYAIREVEDRL